MNEKTKSIRKGASSADVSSEENPSEEGD